MKRQFRSLITVVGLAIALGSSITTVPATQTGEARLRGSGSGQITGMAPGPTGVSITATGIGTATQLGKFTRTESLLLNPNTGTFTGTITFIAADESELYCSVAGGFTGPNTAAGSYTITGGTGRFADASGEAHFAVVQDEATFTFDFIGAIVTP